MDKIDKALNKLKQKEKAKLKNLLLKIDRGELEGLDIKKLRDKKDIFRVRQGDMRIIIHKVDNSTKILSLERRTSKTYKKN
ncbi:MAG: hypothetical protein ABH967_01290 [Patescibacteria group bacterium]